MNNSARVQKAFTLIELLIVVSLITIMTGAIIPGFNSYIINQNMKQAQEAVKNDLRTAQNRALTGANSDTGILYWGVKFIDNSDHYYFVSDDVNTDCASLLSSDQSDNLPGGAVIATSGAAQCVFFSLANGDASGATQIYVTDADGNCRRVDTNSFGLITSYTGAAVCP